MAGEESDKHVVVSVIKPGGELAGSASEIDISVPSKMIAHDYDGKNIPLDNIVDNYIEYADAANLIYDGSIPPINSRIRMWVDRTYEDPNPIMREEAKVMSKKIEYNG